LYSPAVWLSAPPPNSEPKGGEEEASQGGAGTHPVASNGGNVKKSMASGAGAQASKNKTDDMTSKKLGGTRESTKKSIEGEEGQGRKKFAQGAGTKMSDHPLSTDRTVRSAVPARRKAIRNTCLSMTRSPCQMTVLPTT